MEWRQPNSSDLSGSESVLVKQVLSHFAMWVRRDEATQTANIVTQGLNSVMTVSKEVALQEITQLERWGKYTYSKIICNYSWIHKTNEKDEG